MTKLQTLANAQLSHTRDLINNYLTLGVFTGDDAYDALQGALRLSSKMTEFNLNDDVTGLDQYLEDADSGPFQECACDGIAPAFYDIPCTSRAALEE
jgi:hypothetical protein